jgi:hypothetical protein
MDEADQVCGYLSGATAIRQRGIVAGDDHLRGLEARAGRLSPGDARRRSATTRVAGRIRLSPAPQHEEDQQQQDIHPHVVHISGSWSYVLRRTSSLYTRKKGDPTQTATQEIENRKDAAER